MNFLNDSQLGALPSMTPDQMNAADYGIVKCDPSGTILFYNVYEGELAGIQPSSVVGKNFFTMVAPCTNNRLFFGRFKDGAGKGDLNVGMPYTFTYKMKPTNVMVQMYHDKGTSTNWVLVKTR